MMLRLFISFFVLVGLSQPVIADDYIDVITGTPSRIVDGDTIHLKGNKIRLLGIDTPEMKQFCKDEGGILWPCGRRARDMLVGLIQAGDEVKCHITGQDRYQRLLGRCFSSGLDVQKALIAAGFGVAEYTDDYRAFERRAKSQKLGMWAGTFERPRQFRRSN